MSNKNTSSSSSDNGPIAPGDQHTASASDASDREPVTPPPPSSSGGRGSLPQAKRIAQNKRIAQKMADGG